MTQKIEPPEGARFMLDSTTGSVVTVDMHFAGEVPVDVYPSGAVK